MSEDIKMQRLTKKDLALSLHSAGRTVEEIARALETHPSYVANVLAAAGKSPDYSDLYVNSSVQNAYARQFQGVLRFKDVQAARESVARIDELYHSYEIERDRRGQHQAQLTALIGKNRAEGVGKFAEADIFAEWLKNHLSVHSPEIDTVHAPPPEDNENDSYTGTLAFAS
jgi:hypothetical protein